MSDVLDNASSMVTLAAEYQTIARAAQADRWDALIARSGLTPDQLVELRDSDAYGPPITALRDAEARGLDVDNTFGTLVSVRSLNGAEDVASVLHGRVDRWIKAASQTRWSSASNLIAGLIPAALNITDPDMRRALDERADAMERRARMLAEKAVRRGEPWARKLGTPPTDPPRREAWIRELATIAAYRDRSNATGRSIIPGKDAGSIERLGHARRAQAAVDRALAMTRNNPVPIAGDDGLEIGTVQVGGRER
jgi:hypothetical protein